MTKGSACQVQGFAAGYWVCLGQEVPYLGDLLRNKPGGTAQLLGCNTKEAVLYPTGTKITTQSSLYGISPNTVCVWG